MALNRVGNVVVARKHSDAQRRTRPADKGCPTPQQFHKIYNEGRKRPSMGTEGDEARRNQFPGDRHAPGYSNDVKDGWITGSGGDGATAKPGFDHSAPRKAPGGLKASGADMTSSPFSKAHFKRDNRRS
jgi:hypothetical protein